MARYAGKHVKHRYLKAAWEANDDGAGFMFTHENKVHVVKGLMTYNDFITEWKKVPEELPAVAHFRIGTHGDRNSKENTHPFEIFPGVLAMAHNGILNIKNEPPWSDTATFVELVLKRLGASLHLNLGTKFLIEQFIGTHNKLAFLDAKGRITLFNEAQGVVEEGVWYSNYSFRGWSRSAVSYPHGGGYFRDEDDVEDWGGWSEGKHWDFNTERWVGPTIAAGNESVHTPATGTSSDPAAGGADENTSSFDDKVLEQAAVELELREQAREARQSGDEVASRECEAAAAEVQRERIEAIRQHVKEHGGFANARAIERRRSITTKVLDLVKRSVTGDYKSTDPNINLGS